LTIARRNAKSLLAQVIYVGDPVRIGIDEATTLPISSMSSDVNGPRTQRARVILAWKGIGWSLGQFAPIALAFFLDDLEPTHLLGGYVGPGDA
jgi:hypothetical protein